MANPYYIDPLTEDYQSDLYAPKPDPQRPKDPIEQMLADWEDVARIRKSMQGDQPPLSLPRLPVPGADSPETAQARKYASDRGLKFDDPKAKREKRRTYGAAAADALQMLSQIMSNRANRKAPGRQGTQPIGSGFLQALRAERQSEAERAAEIGRANIGIESREREFNYRQEDDRRGDTPSMPDLMKMLQSYRKPAAMDKPHPKIALADAIRERYAGKIPEDELDRMEQKILGLLPDDGKPTTMQQELELLESDLVKGLIPDQEKRKEIARDIAGKYGPNRRPSAQVLEEEEAARTRGRQRGKLALNDDPGAMSEDETKEFTRRLREYMHRGEYQGGVLGYGGPMSEDKARERAWKDIESERRTMEWMLQRSGKAAEVDPIEPTQSLGQGPSSFPDMRTDHQGPSTPGFDSQGVLTPEHEQSLSQIMSMMQGMDLPSMTIEASPMSPGGRGALESLAGAMPPPMARQPAPLQAPAPQMPQAPPPMAPAPAGQLPMQQGPRPPVQGPVAPGPFDQAPGRDPFAPMQGPAAGGVGPPPANFPGPTGAAPRYDLSKLPPGALKQALAGYKKALEMGLATKEELDAMFVRQFGVSPDENLAVPEEN